MDAKPLNEELEFLIIIIKNDEKEECPRLPWVSLGVYVLFSQREGETSA